MPKYDLDGGDDGDDVDDFDMSEQELDFDDKGDEFDENQSVKSDANIDEQPEDTVEIVEDEPTETTEEQLGIKLDTEIETSCLYKVSTKKKHGMSTEVAELDDEIFDDGTVGTSSAKVVPTEERITKPILTKYERVRILGDRRQQLTQGAKPMLKGVDGLSPKEISNLELKNGVIPFIIVRTLPSGMQEHWKISELQIIN